MSSQQDGRAGGAQQISKEVHWEQCPSIHEVLANTADSKYINFVGPFCTFCGRTDCLRAVREKEENWLRLRTWGGVNRETPRLKNSCATGALSLLSVARRLQTKHPQALFLISGDFNHVLSSSVLPTYTQCHLPHCRNIKGYILHPPNPPPSLPWRELTTTLYISSLCTNLWYTGSRCC